MALFEGDFIFFPLAVEKPTKLTGTSPTDNPSFIIFWAFCRLAGDGGGMVLPPAVLKSGLRQSCEGIARNSSSSNEQSNNAGVSGEGGRLVRSKYGVSNSGRHIASIWLCVRAMTFWKSTGSSSPLSIECIESSGIRAFLNFVHGSSRSNCAVGVKESASSYSPAKNSSNDLSFMHFKTFMRNFALIPKDLVRERERKDQMASISLYEYAQNR
jgi:hypothetical protein